MHCHISWTYLTPKETAEVHTWLAGFTWASAKADSTTACLGDFDSTGANPLVTDETDITYVILYYIILSYIILCYIILYYIMLYYVMLYYIYAYIYIYTHIFCFKIFSQLRIASLLVTGPLDHWTTELQELVTAETPWIPKSPTSRWLRAAVKVRWAKSSWSCAHLGSKQILPGTNRGKGSFSPTPRPLAWHKLFPGVHLHTFTYHLPANFGVDQGILMYTHSHFGWLRAPLLLVEPLVLADIEAPYPKIVGSVSYHPFLLLIYLNSPCDISYIWLEYVVIHQSERHIIHTQSP